MKIATGGGKVKIGGLRGLVGHWTMSQDSLKSLTILADKTPYGNDGTIYGATFATDRHGQPNKAMSFDGVNDYVNTPLNGFPDPMTDITISFWTSPSGVLENGSILVAVPDNSNNRINIHFPWSNGNLYWDFGNVSYDSGRLSTPWNPAWNNIWAHWVFISESGVGQKIYRNNVLLASDTNTASFSKGTKSLNIAKYAPNNVFWKGLIDDVRIYNRALSAEEIKLLYESYNPNLKI